MLAVDLTTIGGGSAGAIVIAMMTMQVRSYRDQRSSELALRADQRAAEASLRADFEREKAQLRSEALAERERDRVQIDRLQARVDLLTSQVDELRGLRPSRGTEAS